MFDCNDTDELTPAFSHRQLFVSVCSRSPLEQPTGVPFGRSLSASLAQGRDDAKAVHMCWVFHPAILRHALMLAVAETASRTAPPPNEGRIIVSAASDRIVANPASADRLLRTESQVLAYAFYVISNNHCNHDHLARTCAVPTPAPGLTPAQTRARGQALMDSNSARAGLSASPLSGRRKGKWSARVPAGWFSVGR